MIRMQPSVRANRQRMSQDAAKTPVWCVLTLPQTVAMREMDPPVSDRAIPCVERVRGTRQLRELVAAPAIVVATKPQDLHIAFAQCRKCCQYAKTGAWHDMTPGEPEIEEVTHDDQRLRIGMQLIEVAQQGLLRGGRSNAKVGIADDVAGS